MIIHATTLALAPGGLEGANNPVIGYEQLATLANITATSALASDPITNVCNPATDLGWVSASTAEQYITIMHNRVDPVDYVALAEHNLGSTGCAISIEVCAALDEFDDPIWVAEISSVLLANDQPVLFRYNPQSLLGIRIKLEPNGVAPAIAVLNVGKLLVLPRPIYGGHTPIPLGRQTQVSSGRAERGRFLGRIIMQESVSTSVSLQHLPKGWYRTHFDPFVRFAEAGAFFWAWRPQEFPNEVGYSWLTNSPRPVNSAPEGFMDVELNLGGIVT